MNQNDQNLQRLFQDDLSGDESEFDGFDAREIDALDRRLAVLQEVDSDTECEFRVPLDPDSDEDVQAALPLPLPPQRGRGRGRGCRRGRGGGRGNADQQPQAAQPPLAQQLQWIPCNIGQDIARRTSIPQHPTGDALQPTMQYAQRPTPIAIFSEFFSDEVIDGMVIETNRYAQQLDAERRNYPVRRDVRIYRWNDTNAEEIRAFIALRISMGLSPKNQVKDYFTSISSFWLTVTPNYRRVMSLFRYEQLASYLHFANNVNQVRDRDDDRYDPLFKLRPLIDRVVPSWRAAIRPAQHLAIDESMIPFRGKIFFRQYIKSKHHRYGVKGFALCDSATCYCIDYDIYTGRFYDYDRTLGQGCSVVLKLVSNMPFGSKLYTDNFYTSPILAKELWQLNIGLIGTVRPNRQGMPDALRAQPVREPKFVFSDPILATSFQDRNAVRMLSTVHSTEMRETRSRATAAQREAGNANADGYIVKRLPEMTCDYNKHMRGVDGLDQLCSYNIYPHRARKWYVKVFDYLFEISLINARILLELQTDEEISASCFRQQLIDQLLDPYLQAKGIERPVQVAGQRRAPQPDDFQRLEGRHFFEVAPTRSSCVACSRAGPGRENRVKTTNRCKTCPDHPHLCSFDCFERYHTMVNYFCYKPCSTYLAFGSNGLAFNSIYMETVLTCTTNKSDKIPQFSSQALYCVSIFSNISYHR